MILVISAKCSDLCYAAIHDDEGNLVAEKDGYVPYFEGLGGGDYLVLDIDLATGKIVGWEPVLTKEMALEKLNGE